MFFLSGRVFGRLHARLSSFVNMFKKQDTMSDLIFYKEIDNANIPYGQTIVIFNLSSGSRNNYQKPFLDENWIGLVLRMDRLVSLLLSINVWSKTFYEYCTLTFIWQGDALVSLLN